MDFLFNTNVEFFIVAYLVGAIPFGLLLAKRFAGVDVKSAGSGSIGATNVLRVVKESNPALAKKLGAMTLALDALKGVLVLTVAYFYGVSEATMWGIAVLAVVGHCFSPFLMFEGGKGVATGFGVLSVMMPIPALIAIVVWGIASRGLKISSLSSLIGLVAFIIASYLLYPVVDGIGSHSPIWIIAIIITYKHTPNIVRLFKKEEGAVV